MADGGDYPEFYSAHEPKARKEHRCDECGRTIAAGEKYRRHFGIQDGSPFDGKTCRHCQVPMQWLATNCGAYLHHAIIEDFQEHAFEYPKLAFGIGRVVVGARRKWKRFDGAGLMPVQPMPRSIESVVFHAQ